MHPVYTQGKIRAAPQISEDLHAENLRSAAPATSNETRKEEARPAEPKAEDRQVGELKPEAVTEGDKPQRARSRPLGPREQAVVTLGQAASRRGAAAQTHGEQVGDANPKTVAAESKPQRARSRPLGPRPPASELLGRTPTRRQGQEEAGFQRPVRRPSGPRESYGAVEEILNMYHHGDDFYERYNLSDITMNNSSIRSRGRESEVPPLSRFDWTPSDSDDGRARQYLKEKKRISKKRLRNLKEKVKDQTDKAVRSIKSLGAVFKEIRRRR